MLNGREEKTIRLSVIMPTYNDARTIIGTIQSLRSQSFKDWELIIINAGSLDGTGKMVTPLLAYDKRIRYLYQSEGNLLQAARQGVQMARGEMVMIMSAEENCMLYNLERAVKQLEIMPGLEAVVGRKVAAKSCNSGLLVMRTDILLDTALLYSRLDNFDAATLYRKLVRAGVMFGFVNDTIELTAEVDSSIFAASAAKRIRQFGQRLEVPVTVAAQ